jgi:phytoene dehydrogenase-like protein
MYGLNASPLKYKLEGGLGFRYRTPIPGLFLCGQDAVGCGVAAALASGMCAAVAVAGPGVEKAIGKEKDMWQ